MLPRDDPRQVQYRTAVERRDYGLVDSQEMDPLLIYFWAVVIGISVAVMGGFLFLVYLGTTRLYEWAARTWGWV